MSSRLSSINTLVTHPVKGDVQPKRRVRLWGNGIDPIPYRQTDDERVPDIKASDPPHRRPQEVWEAHACVFHLEKDEDLQDYNRIIGLIGKGRALHSFERVEWNDKRNNFVVFLRWIELFMEMPKNKQETTL